MTPSRLRLLSLVALLVPIALTAALYAVAYLVWERSDWGSPTVRDLIGNVAFMPLNLAVAALNLAASRSTVLDPGVRTILLVEAPTVLGFKRWRALDDAHSFQSLRAGVDEALLNGTLAFDGPGDDLAAMDTRAGAHIDDVIGGADRVLVMLDDEDGVAEIAQAAQRGEQHVVVALMQADAGLVEDVEDAGQAGADL